MRPATLFALLVGAALFVPPAAADPTVYLSRPLPFIDQIYDVEVFGQCLNDSPPPLMGQCCLGPPDVIRLCTLELA